MNYTVLSEHPTRFEIPEPHACEDCEELVTILTDTIAGYLCDDCSQRFHNAAHGLCRRALVVTGGVEELA